MAAAPKPKRGEAIPIDWGALVGLRLRARAVAEGVYAGAHRSTRRGPGVEFGGHRPYVSGDDLRFLDRRSMLRHDRLMIRQFETETDRALWLVVDATASMAFRGTGAPGAKLAYAAVCAAGLARIALASGDPVGLEWIGGHGVRPLPATAGREGFERVLGALESAAAGGDARFDDAAVERALAPVARRARRGSTIVLLSDLLDLPPRARAAFCALATAPGVPGAGRTLVVVRVLDPVEADLSFDGTVRLRAMEGDHVVEADVATVRAEYQARLEAIASGWERELEARGGRLVRAVSRDEPADVVRRVVQAVAEAHR